MKVSQHFRGTYHLHLQDQSVHQARNYHKEGRACCLLHAGLLPGLLFDLDSSEMSVDFHWTSIKDKTLHSHDCENLKPNTFNSVLIFN
jgi:hypothetical protein